MVNTPLRRALAVWAAWTVWGLFIANRSFLLYSLSGRDPIWWVPYALALPAAWYWAALTPGVVALMRRLPFRGTVRPVHVLIHLVVACIAAAGDLTADILLARIVEGVNAPFWTNYVTQLNTNLLLYFALVAAVGFVGYQRERRERDVRAAQLEAELARAQLEVLRMQFHPHFLFNSLNAISELIHRDPVAAEHTISRLGDLLRMSLDQQEQEIPLGEELELLDLYMDIQKTRFGGRLRTRFELDDGLSDALVPSFVLQPLVENAIRHGVGRLNRAGTIIVRAKRGEGENLVLEVADDGEGLPPNVRPNIGLSNTYKRIRQLYGRAASVEISNNADAGATATIHIPLNILTESTA